MNAGGGFAVVACGTHDPVGAADEIAAGEYAGGAGHLAFIHDRAAPFVDLDFVGVAGKNVPLLLPKSMSQSSPSFADERVRAEGILLATPTQSY